VDRGTGKSVVAINVLVALIKHGLVTQYVTKNAAPRAVYESLLTGMMLKTEITNLFSGSGSFVDLEKNIFDALVVDEAHRLNEKSGLYKNFGENQIKEIVEASKFSVFFIDEDQKVTWSDIGQVDEIIKWAEKDGAHIEKMELLSQFRCSGSDGYLAWLDNSLQIRETANLQFDQTDYDFKVVESPVMDIRISEFNFGMKWNLATDGSLWILGPESVNEVGCIHTCQGLEMDYVGVIIGPDLIVRDSQVMTDPTKRARTDKSLQGYKKSCEVDPDAARKKADAIIKNTYRTLMTRGMKGCYIFCTDPETQEYFKKMFSQMRIPCAL
jgi:DUF2075 family protein